MDRREGPEFLGAWVPTSLVLRGSDTPGGPSKHPRLLLLALLGPFPFPSSPRTAIAPGNTSVKPGQTDPPLLCSDLGSVPLCRDASALGKATTPTDWRH